MYFRVMLFNSFSFLVFFLIFFAAYWSIPAKRLDWQNVLLLIASYIFYGWWDWRFLSLITLASATSYFGAIAMNKNENSKRYILTFIIAVHLGMLFAFKYLGFFVHSASVFMQQLGFSVHTVYLQIALPVGISFFTFQSLSYAIDVYRGQIKNCTSWVSYFAFISFFPQLVAGPIERAAALLPQVESKRQFNNDHAYLGLQLIFWGLIKKMLVADTCASEVDLIFSNPEAANAIQLWWGAFLFGVQIYCDFSAYSEMAMGLAYLLGFRLMRNFHYPYFALNIKDFWKRWHISLTTWFKDYVFIPLGGSKVSRQRLAINVLVVFALSGVWHGANFTFIAWGLFHALLYISYVLWIEKSNIRIPEFLSWIFTFIPVMIGWVFFRAEDMHIAQQYLQGMFDYSVDGLMPAADPGLLGSLALLFSVEWLNRKHRFGLDIGRITHAYVRWSLYLFLLTVWLVYAHFEELAFIYFDF